MRKVSQRMRQWHVNLVGKKLVHRKTERISSLLPVWPVGKMGRTERTEERMRGTKKRGTKKRGTMMRTMGKRKDRKMRRAIGSFLLVQSRDWIVQSIVQKPN